MATEYRRTFKINAILDETMVIFILPETTVGEYHRGSAEMDPDSRLWA